MAATRARLESLELAAVDSVAGTADDALAAGTATSSVMATAAAGGGRHGSGVEAADNAVGGALEMRHDEVFRTADGSQTYYCSYVYFIKCWYKCKILATRLMLRLVCI